MQSYVFEIAKEKNEEHHTKSQLYDLSAFHPVEATNSQVLAIRDIANNYSEIHEQLNDSGEDAMRQGEAMTFYGEKMNLNSNNDHSMSDDGCNNDNYDTSMRREKDGIACGKQKLQVVIPERVEASKASKTPSTSSSHVRKVRILEHEQKWSNPIF
ncbi:hypothetical protein PanWU01x14_269140 [Parasponia andersonii]|uniref:Uncharacterized protein n=1 Tax=Parasponia andersonii TaxID=3476 RepID=A0A2P5B5R6_PARAD|nr:hypothetical protein PanWU01x14_269140 [Parasponia andersonii]